MRKALFFVVLYLFVACEKSPSPENPPADTPSSDWVTEEVKAPFLSYHRFYSGHAKREVSFHVFLPPAYEAEDQQNFPVMYWLHGSGDGLIGIPLLSNFYAQAMNRGDIPPFIIVFPYGFTNGMWSNSKNGKYPVEDVLIRDLIPFVDANFRTKADRSHRIVEGFSMGGHGAARLGFKFPEQFASASLFGAGPLHLDFLERGPVAPAKRREVFAMTYGNDQAYYEAQHPRTWAQKNATEINTRLHLRQVVGTSDALHPFNEEFRDYLRELGIEPDYREVEGVGHETLPLLRGLGPAHWAFYHDLWP